MLVATVFLVMALVAIGAAAGLGARGIGWKLAILPLFQSLGVVGLGVGLSIGRPIGAAIGVFLALLGTVATVVSYRRWLETPLGELERVMVSLQRGEAASLSEAARFKPFAGISDRLASLLRRQEEVIALLDGMTVYDLSHRVTPGGPHDRLAAAAAKSLENIPGVDFDYEPPESADLTLPTHQISPEESVNRILDLLRSKGFLR